MAAWERQEWHSVLGSGLPRRDRASGPYDSYLPDRLTAAPLQLPAALDQLVARAERAVAGLTSGSRDLAGIARFLLRSEAISSSRIEGIAPSVQQVALAELSSAESVSQVSDLAQLVANNMGVVEQARTALVAAPRVNINHIIELHAALLPDQPGSHGPRQVQNWIGGSRYHPIGADFVPPAPQHVPDLLTDLTNYLNGAAHSPIIQAGLVHAQFETIHPFADGNGRVGRALIHTVLTRRGLTPAAVLPVSLVLSTRRNEYVNGLMGYRHAGTLGSPEYHAAREAWLQTFCLAVLDAAEQADQLAADLAALRDDWFERLTESRQSAGLARNVRSDSATALVLRDLPGTPVLTNATVQRIHQVSHVAAGRALDELASAGILIGRRRGAQRLYQAPEIIDLITSTERRLASTQFDTRLSPPNRPVPARPPAPVSRPVPDD